jgi:4-aminobutyrate aminotransferase
MQRDERVMMQSFSRWYPVVVESGEGSYVYDIDGNRFLDFNAGIAVNALGYNNPSVLEAIRRQISKLLHYSFTDFLYEQAITISEKLVAISPTGTDSRVFLTNSGTEAIEAMIKTARWSTRRPTVLAFSGSFHGRTLGSLSLTASKPVQRRYFGPLLPDVEHVPFPYCYRCPFKMDPSTCGLYCVDFIADELFSKYVPPEEVSVFVTEIIQGEGGYVPAPDDYFRKLKRLLDRYGILLGVDEVQSGIGRTGNWFAVEGYGIKPDLLASAKALGGGLPLGALIGKSELMELDKGSHASTFGGNPVACAAGLSTITEIERLGLLDEVKKKGALIMRRLSEWKDMYELVGDVRGRGLMIGIELVKDKQSKEAAVKELNQVLTGCFKKGLLVIAAGKSTIRIAPPLTIKEEDVMIGLDILEGELKKVSQQILKE